MSHHTYKNLGNCGLTENCTWVLLKDKRFIRKGIAMGEKNGNIVKTATLLFPNLDKILDSLSQIMFKKDISSRSVSKLSQTECSIIDIFNLG